MTDTFILQLPDIDEKVYYIPEIEQYETPVTTLNVDDITTIKNKSVTNNSSSSSCSSVSNSSNFLSNSESFYYGFDFYDVESIYDSFGSITNTTTKIKQSTYVTETNNNNNNNNLFHDKNFTLESSLNVQTQFKLSPSYFQNTIENNCTNISTKRCQSQTQSIVESLTPSSEYYPQQFTILSPTPLRSNDMYCPLLHTENLTYEQYLRSDEFNNEKCVIAKDFQNNASYDFNYYYYYYSNKLLKSSNTKRKSKKKAKKYKKRYLDILSTFSNYSSLFSKCDQKNTKIKKDYKKHKENINKVSRNNIVEEKLTLRELEVQNENKNVSINVNNNQEYCPFDIDFVTTIENKLNRYNTKAPDKIVSSDSKTPDSNIHNNNQDILDKIRLQEVSYRFSKSYF